MQTTTPDPGTATGPGGVVRWPRATTGGADLDGGRGVVPVVAHQEPTRRRPVWGVGRLAESRRLVSVVYWLQNTLFFAFYLAILVASGWALIDALRRPVQAFVAEGKRTKVFWASILGVAVVVSFVATPFPGGAFVGGPFGLLALASAVAALVYLFDVRPAIAPHSRRRGRGGGSSRW